ncbi:MAG: hypothetical protein A2Y33_08430 [Spirochaetes bacterium GWF1_51_8]|nr:MAG: hypothetical protein A2Y33_08430 [Spirochaetes bacterium GWF1_51_8]
MNKVFAGLILSMLILFTGCDFFDELYQPKDILSLIVRDSIDTDAPVITVTYPVDGQTIGLSNTMYGTAVDQGSGVKAVYARTDNNSYVAVTVINNLWSIPLNYSSYGIHTNYVYAEDNKANKSDVLTIIIETSKVPTVVFTTPAINYSATVSNQFTLCGTASIDPPYTITFIQMQVNGGNWTTITGTDTWSNTISLYSGTNYFIVRANANNGTFGDSAKWALIRDTIKPIVTFIYPAGGQAISGRIYTSSVSAYDSLSSISAVYISDDGLVYETATNTQGSWQKEFTVPYTGKYTNYSYALDIAGNISTTNKVIFTINPDKLVTHDGASGDEFAYCVAVSADGSTIAVGAHKDNSSTGSVYIFKFSGGTWSTNKLVAFDGAPGDEFGSSVAITPDGNTVVIGAYCDNDHGDLTGAAYVFKYSGTWSGTKLTAFDGTNNDCFGKSVAVSADGSTVVVGAFGDDDKGADSGSAYLFKYSGTWSTNKFVAYDGAANHFFGTCVAVSADGNTIIAGADGDNTMGDFAGSAYVFKYSGTWSTNKLMPSDAVEFKSFGSCVAVSSNGNTIVIGASGDDEKGSGSGAAYVFKYSGIWSTNKLVAYDGAVNDSFGNSVAISADGNTVVVGSKDDDDKGDSSGSAYLFKYSGTWSTNKLVAYDGAANDNFGNSVAISADGNTTVIGACYDDDQGNSSGSAYVYHW